MTKGVIIMHVGAGYHSKKKEDSYKKLLMEIARSSQELLTRNESDDTPVALRVALFVLKALEDSPLTNAGISGSNFTEDGKIECDASIMSQNSFGSVGAVPMTAIHLNDDQKAKEIVLSPSEMALKVWRENQKGIDLAGRVSPLTLVGDAAHSFCISKGSLYSTSSQAQMLLTQEQIAKYHTHMSILRECNHSEVAETEIEEEHLMDTVGVIVMDHAGNIASGVSSGGITLKQSGRVGHAAIFGAGVWAQNSSSSSNGIGISATGTGEHLVLSRITSTLAQELCQPDRDTMSSIQKTVQKDLLQSPLLIDHDEKHAGMIILRSDPMEQSNDTNPSVELCWMHTTHSICLAYQSLEMDHPQFVLSRQNGHGQSICIGGTMI